MEMLMKLLTDAITAKAKLASEDGFPDSNAERGFRHYQDGKLAGTLMGVAYALNHLYGMGDGDDAVYADTAGALVAKLADEQAANDPEHARKLAETVLADLMANQL